MLPDFLLFLAGFSGGGTEPTLARVLGHHYMRLPGAVSELMEERPELINECSSFPWFFYINIESY
jgi:hypothetical protein